LPEKNCTNQASDGTAINGCFAGHCDWRLPTTTELADIVDSTQGLCAVPLFKIAKKFINAPPSGFVPVLVHVCLLSASCGSAGFSVLSSQRDQQRA
jgi:hypothetical protein